MQEVTGYGINAKKGYEIKMISCDSCMFCNSDRVDSPCDRCVGYTRYQKGDGLNVEIIHHYEDCKYCCDDVDMRDYLLSDGNEGIYIDGNSNLTGDDGLDFHDKKLNFCPICGRKL